VNKVSRIDFVIPFGDSVLVKQIGWPLQIVNLRGDQVLLLENPISDNAHYIVLLNHDFFISRSHGFASVWNRQGNLINQYLDDMKPYNTFDTHPLGACCSYRIEEDAVSYYDLLSGSQIGRFGTHPFRNLKVVGHEVTQDFFVTANSRSVQIWGNSN
jgi:hypothetical protein